MNILNEKVCILTSVHPAIDVRIFYKEARSLTKVGYEVTLIAQHYKNEIVDGMKIIALLKPKNRFFRMFFLTRKVYKLALKQKAGVYHFHDPELIPVGLLLKIFTKAKIIYDVHENVAKAILSKDWIPKIVRLYISKIFNIFEKTASKKFDYIIAATTNIKDNFKAHKICQVIDIKNYPVVDGARAQKIIKENKKYFEPIYVGGLSRIRGIKEIVLSSKYINPKYNVRLKLIGEFSDEEFRNEIKGLDEWSSVKFLGWLPSKETIEHLLMADMAIICFWPEPNHVEAMPNKIFEYMAASLPIVASNFPLWKEIIEGNNCGICVNPLNPKEITKAIEYLIEHPEEAKRMGKNSRRAVLEKYNWEKESEKLLEIYKNILKSK